MKHAKGNSKLERVNGCYVAWQPKAWVDSELLCNWIDTVFPPVLQADGKVLVWDSMRAHVSEAVKSKCASRSISMCVVPGGLTPYLQAGDIGIYRHFKDLLCASIDEWKDSDQAQYTRGGNPKPPEANTTATSFVQLLQHSSADTGLNSESSAASSDEDMSEDENAEEMSREEVGEDGEVVCHGRVWQPCSEVLIDSAAHIVPHTSRLRWPYDTPSPDRSFADYFSLLYPMQSLRSMLHHTNYTLVARGCAPITDGDWFRWIGIRLAMAFEPRRGPTRTYWESDAWKGKEGKYSHDGLPHKTKIARKPEGKGTELKAIADGDSGILLGLELVEGTTRQRAKPYWTARISVLQAEINELELQRHPHTNAREQQS
ncbi:hypothetical protein ATCC90586_004525 [Pythium insidiosum]|nr:hypothetical protein ATCC90586_004525 [Pythium insidiosum]